MFKAYTESWRREGNESGKVYIAQGSDYISPIFDGGAIIFSLAEGRRFAEEMLDMLNSWNGKEEVKAEG